MCLAMSTEISLGIGLYEVAKLLHLSIFVNGTLLNMETWPKCTEARISRFEKVEQNFMRRILKAHSKTPIEALYLELGIVPLRFHLMKRRILYLNDILNREEGELTKQVVEVQAEKGSKGDFYEQATSDQRELDISNVLLTGNKEKLKEEIVKNMEERAYQFLLEKARKHSKIREDVYVNRNGFDHYNDTRFTPDMISLLFKFRTRTYLVKINFRNNYKNTDTLCPLCEKNEDSQKHIFECDVIKESYEKEIQCSQEDVFTNDKEKLFLVTKTLMDITNIRENILNPEQNDVK